MTAMVLSYQVGQKYYPIDYPIKEMAMYVVLTLIIYVVMTRLCPQLPVWAALIVNTLLIVAFMAVVVVKDLPVDRIVARLKRK
jgi:hypothetical protein